MSRSSDSIRAEIQSTENSIAVLEGEIKTLQVKIENQSYAVSAYSRRLQDCESEIQDKTTRINTVGGYDTTAVLSYRFKERLDSEFIDKKQHILDEANNINTKMQALSENEHELDRKQGLLQSSRSKLTWLQSELNSALASEEAERQAASAAATATRK